jgi:hypothetical protein
LLLDARLLAMEPSAVLVVCLLAMEPSPGNMYAQDLEGELGPTGNVAFGPPLLYSSIFGGELWSASSVALDHPPLCASRKN